MSDYKLIIDDTEERTDYQCTCQWCINTHKLGLQFDHFEPKTNLQKRMSNVIKELEARYKESHRCNDYEVNGVCTICGFEF